jgi:hypothetical protein
MVDVDKVELRRRLVLLLEQERDTVAAAQRRTQEGVTHEDNRPEGDKDMRSTEAAYVARGQAMRVRGLEDDLARVVGMTLRGFDADAPVALSALVELEGEAGKSLVFVAPAGGGTRLDVGGATVLVVTPASPLGKALVGARRGDEVEVHKGGAVETVEILEVR